MTLSVRIDYNQNSQSKRLRINKQSPEASSSVPRARFQKARPNVSSFERDSNLPPVPNNYECEGCVKEELQSGKENTCLPVPQLTLSEDGEIVVDKEKLFLKRKTVLVTKIIERGYNSPYYSYLNRIPRKKWTLEETAAFFRALSLTGTNFDEMEKLIPNRTRRELKLKFKREERERSDLVDKLIYEQQLTYDTDILEEYIQNQTEGDIYNNHVQDYDRTSVLKGNKKSLKSNRKRKRKQTEIASTECIDSQTKPSKEIANGIEASDENELNNKKRREHKKLFEDFLSIDETEGDNYVSYFSKGKCKDDEYQHKSPCRLSISCGLTLFDDPCDVEITWTPQGVEIVHLEDTASVDQNSNQEASDTVFVKNDAFSLNANGSSLANENAIQALFYSNEQHPYIKVKLKPSYNTVDEINRLNVVTAGEIAALQTVKGERRRNVKEAVVNRTVDKTMKNTSQPSFANFTPTEDSTLTAGKKQLLTPKPNIKTYSKIQCTPEYQNVLFTSLQTPSLKPMHSTTLNVSSNQPVTILIKPQQNASLNNATILKKYPNL